LLFFYLLLIALSILVNVSHFSSTAE
jgi:hypothetical protein